MSTNANWLEEINRRLRERYRDPRHFNKDDPLDELVFVTLSTRTPEARYVRLYDEFRDRFTSWQDVSRAPLEEVIATLQTGGLARRKARDLLEIFGRLGDDFGEVSLDALRLMTDEDAERYLTSLPGVGTKVARCVLMYSLGRAVLPVDAHTWRICSRLTLASGGRVPTRRQADELQSRIPPQMRYSLHVNMVALGRELCKPRRPRCTHCPIRSLCSGYDAALSTSNSTESKA